MGSKSGQQQETGAQKAQATHAVEQLNDYKQRWLPVQQQLASKIEGEGEANSAERKLATGKATTDTAMQFGKANTGLDASLSNAGVGPGSSRANLAITGLGSDAAASSGLGKEMSDQAITDAYTQGLGALSALGRGESASVGSGMTALAQNSSEQAAADARAALMNREGNAQVAGQVAGFGIQQAMKGLGTSTPAGSPGWQGNGINPSGAGFNPGADSASAGPWG